MRRWMFTIIILILAVIFIILKANTEFNYYLKSFFSDEVVVFYSNDNVGTIFEIMDLVFPDGESLKKYYCRDKIIWEGKTYFSLLDSSYLEQRNYILGIFKNSEVMQKRVVINDEELVLLSVKEKTTNLLVIFIYDLINKRGLRIYGEDYTIDDACQLAQIILFGSVHEYTIIASEKLINSKEYNEEAGLPF